MAVLSPEAASAEVVVNFPLTWAYFSDGVRGEPSPASRSEAVVLRPLAMSRKSLTEFSRSEIPSLRSSMRQTVVCRALLAG